MERARWRPVAVSLLALVAIHALPLAPSAQHFGAPTMVLGVSVTAPPSPATTAPASTPTTPAPGSDEQAAASAEDTTPARAEVALDTAQLRSSEPASTAPASPSPVGRGGPDGTITIGDNASPAAAPQGDLLDLAPLFDDLDRLAESAAASEAAATGAADAAQPGPAPTTVTTPPLPNHLAMAASALDAISLDWQALLPDWRVEFLEGRSGYLGSTWPAKQLIEVYVRDAQSPEDVAHILAHEIGHALDVTLNNTEDRARWRATRGIAADTEWFVCCGRNDFSSPAGDFAESFAVWQVGAGNYRGRVADPPDAAQLAVMSELVLS